MYYTAQNATLFTPSRILINKVNTSTVIICSYTHLLAEGKLCGQNSKGIFLIIIKKNILIDTATYSHEKGKAEDSGLALRKQ